MLDRIGYTMVDMYAARVAGLGIYMLFRDWLDQRTMTAPGPVPRHDKNRWFLLVPEKFIPCNTLAMAYLWISSRRNHFDHRDMDADALVERFNKLLSAPTP